MVHETPHGSLFDFGLLHMEWPTALFVFVVFMITMIGLNTLLFKPLLRTLSNRDDEIEKHRTKAGNAVSSIEAAEQEYEKSLTEAKAQVEAVRNKNKEEALEESKSIINEARNATQAKLEGSQAEVAKELEQAHQDAKNIAAELSDMIQSKALNKSA